MKVTRNLFSAISVLGIVFFLLGYFNAVNTAPDGGGALGGGLLAWLGVFIFVIAGIIALILMGFVNKNRK